MSNDISDILAALSPPSSSSHPLTTASSTRNLDLQALTRAWVNERVAPDLLPYPAPLVERSLAGVRAQIEQIEILTDGGAGFGGGVGGPGERSQEERNFQLVVLQTELERWRFLIRGLVRARIAKLDHYPLHYRALTDAADQDHSQLSSQSTRATTTPLLSTLEQQYLTAHQALLGAHFHSAFLAQFPPALQNLADTGGGISMVDRPDEDTAVFCRVLRDCEDAVSRRAGVKLLRGDVWVLRWRSIKKFVERGDVELI